MGSTYIFNRIKKTNSFLSLSSSKTQTIIQNLIFAKKFLIPLTKITVALILNANKMNKV